MKKKPAVEQVDFLRDIVERNVRALVEHEDKVEVETTAVPGQVVFVIRAHEDDVGLVLGERGMTINAIRRIVWIACKKTDLRADINVPPVT